MRSVLVTILLLSLSAGAVLAQGGSITLSSNSEYNDCAISDTPGLVTVYLIHDWTPIALGARFTVVPGPNVWMTYLGEEMNYTVESGSALTGITVCYETCLAGPIVIGSIHYFGQGLTQACSFMFVEPHPEANNIEVLDCDLNVVYGSGGNAIVNPDASCPCYCAPVNTLMPLKDKKNLSEMDDPPFCSSVPAQQFHWGRIKAIYAR